jgi:hypothetical protein
VDLYGFSAYKIQGNRVLLVVSGVLFLVSSEAIPSHFHIYCSVQTQLHLGQFFGCAEAQIILL